MSKIKLYSSVWIYVVAVSLSVSLCVLIFIKSGETATVSAEQSGGISEFLASVFVPDFEKLEEFEKTEIVLKIHHFVRKTVHFCMYATLGALFEFSSLWHSRTWLSHFIVAWILSVLYAISDEIHQAFVPGRGPMVSDVVLDSAGAFVGVSFALVFALIIQKVKKSRTIKLT